MMRYGCWRFGHDDVANPTPGHLSVVCRHCGRESAGVDIPAPRYRRTQEGRPDATRVKRRLARTWLAYRLMGES